MAPSIEQNHSEWLFPIIGRPTGTEIQIEPKHRFISVRSESQ